MFNIKKLFGAKSKSLLGIDISSSGVKIVQLSRHGKRYVVDGYACESLPKGAVVNGVVQEVDKVSDAISHAIDKSGCTATQVALAMPNQSVIMRTVAFPIDFSDAMLEQQMEADAAQHVPFPLDEVRLDFCPTGKRVNEEEQEILLVAAKRDLVDGRLASVETLGLTPTVMDVESYCVQRTVGFMADQLPGAGAGLVLALVDVGAQSLSITVVSGDQVLFEREQPFGGGQLTQDIARTYSLKPEEAELKKRNGDLPPDYASTLLQPFVDSAATTIARSLQFFFTSTQYNRVDQIMLAGGCSVLPGMVDAVVSKTQMPATLSQPTRGMELGSRIRERQLQLDAPMLTIAFGLALRGFD
jgi:type IV pilus assembly protein PilM